MEDLVSLVIRNADSAPLILFLLLLVAGLNIPVPEDLVVFAGALLAATRPDLMPRLVCAVLLGAFLGDLECYWLARLLGPRLWKLPGFSRIATPERVEACARFYARYGVITLFLGRYIPFGARNALMITAGIARMDARRFALADAAAVPATTGLYFLVYLAFGEGIASAAARTSSALFFIALAALVLWWSLARRRARRRSVEVAII